MKKYSPIKKGIVCALNIIFAVMMALSILFTAAMLERADGDWASMGMNKDFASSDSLANQLYSQAGYIQDYVWQKDLLETKGELDYSKKIDAFKVQSFYNGEASFKTGMNYTLKELMKYADIYNDVLENEDAYYDVEQGKPISYENVSASTDFAPDGYKSVEEYASENDYAVTSCYKALYVTLDSINRVLEDYSSNAYAFDPKNTNIRYQAKDENGKVVYDNGKEPENPSKKITETGNDYTIEVVADMDFPVSDSISDMAQSEEEYGRVFGSPKLYIMGLILGIVGFLSTLIYMTVLAGHKDDTETIVLNAIDKIPTEIAAIVWAVLGITLIFSAISTGSGFFWNYYLGDVILCILFLVALSVAFLCAYLSLVRRIKAKTLGSNSLCHILKHICKYTYSHGNVAVRVLGGFLLYLLLSVVLMMAFQGLGVFMWLVMNIAVGYLLLRDSVSRMELAKGLQIITGGDINYQVDSSKMQGYNKEMADGINNISGGLSKAMEQSMKDERLKTDLITNVSHDIKTPLTSIINYVDLLKREDINDPKVKGYIDVLDQKSQRLKNLTEDLVEASKISSGNITLVMDRMDFKELLMQMIGEFQEKFESKNLQVVTTQPDTHVIIEADGRRMWRVVSNLFQNVYKYAMPNTRVYVDLKKEQQKMCFSVKNISEFPLNIEADELTERFIRGDVSRNTEGSGLGLSIAQNLTTMQKGKFQLYLDGDLFKVTLEFPLK